MVVYVIWYTLYSSQVVPSQSDYRNPRTCCRLGGSPTPWGVSPHFPHSKRDRRCAAFWEPYLGMDPWHCPWTNGFKIIPLMVHAAIHDRLRAISSLWLDVHWPLKKTALRLLLPFQDTQQRRLGPKMSAVVATSVFGRYPLCEFQSPQWITGYTNSPTGHPPSALLFSAIGSHSPLRCRNVSLPLSKIVTPLLLVLCCCILPDHNHAASWHRSTKHISSQLFLHCT
jgi:hypothetical protein